MFFNRNFLKFFSNFLVYKNLFNLHVIEHSVTNADFLPIEKF